MCFILLPVEFNEEFVEYKTKKLNQIVIIFPFLSLLKICSLLYSVPGLHWSLNEVIFLE